MIYSREDGMNSALDIDGISFEMGVFSLDNLHLYYDGSEDIFGGEVEMTFGASADKLTPGRGEEDSNSRFRVDEDGHITIVCTEIPEEMKSVPVRVQNSDGELIEETNFNRFVEANRLSSSITFAVEIQFMHGKLNALVITVEYDIPLANSGLVLAAVTGGVRDIQTDLTVLAN